MTINPTKLQIDLWRMIFDPAVLVAVVAAIWGFGKWRGRTNERIKEVERNQKNMEAELKACGDRLSDGSEFSARIDERLKSLKEGQNRIEESVAQKIDSLQDFILNLLGKK